MIVVFFFDTPSFHTCIFMITDFTLKEKLHQKLLLLCLVLLNSACSKEKFTGWEQREIEIIRLFSNEQYPEGNERLKSWLLSTPEVIDYPFDSLQQSDDIFFRKVISPDQKLCVFSWNKVEHFKTVYWGNIIYYWTPTGYKRLNCSLWQAGEMDEPESILELGCFTQSIHQITRDDGQTIYLTKNFLRTHSTECFTLINPYILENGKLRVAKGIYIREEGKTSNELFCEYNLPNWLDRTGNVDTYSELFDYNELKQEWLIPMTDTNNTPTDKYEHYIYDGKNIVFKDIVEGKGLHPKLLGFERLEQLYDVGEYFVRVDLMKDSTYRYTSWRREEMPDGILDMSSHPDIIVEGGYMDEAEGYYVFPNGSYEYRLNINPTYTYELKLFVEGKIDYHWKKEH